MKNDFFYPMSFLQRGFQVTSSAITGLLTSVLTDSNDYEWKKGFFAAAYIFLLYELYARSRYKKAELEAKKQQQLVLSETKREEALNDLLQADPESENPWPITVICPITMLPIKDPVQTPDGNLYERDAILRWIEQNPTDPLNNQLLSKHNLLACPELKAQLALYEKKVGRTHLNQFKSRFFEKINKTKIPGFFGRAIVQHRKHNNKIYNMLNDGNSSLEVLEKVREYALAHPHSDVAEMINRIEL